MVSRKNSYERPSPPPYRPRWLVLQRGVPWRPQKQTLRGDRRTRPRPHAAVPSPETPGRGKHPSPSRAPNRGPFWRPGSRPLESPLRQDNSRPGDPGPPLRRPAAARARRPSARPGYRRRRGGLRRIKPRTPTPPGVRPREGTRDAGRSPAGCHRAAPPLPATAFPWPAPEQSADAAF